MSLLNEQMVKKCVQNSFLYRLGDAPAFSGNDALCPCHCQKNVQVECSSMIYNLREVPQLRATRLGIRAVYNNYAMPLGCRL